jgi:hypothetical protein
MSLSQWALKAQANGPIGSMIMVFKRRRKRKPSFSVRKWDPLYIIFERHLYDFNYDSRELFLKGVVEEYLLHLAKQKAVVPATWRSHLEKSLEEEVSDMLVRRLYGCLKVEEARPTEESKTQILEARSESRKRYQKLVG